MPPAPHKPGLHAFAVIVAVATFPLIFIGGLVTSHGAGMAVPDWPNSFGYNMFLFPPSLWVGNIWYEHVHRLYGDFVGLLSIVLCAWAWIGHHRRQVRWLATSVLAAVIVQGVLGGERVVLAKLGLAIIHGCFAQAVFCLVVCTSVVTSGWWVDAPDLSQAAESTNGKRLVRFAIAAVVIVYCQLIIGAIMRHHQAGLAIPDFPLSYGKLLPPMNQNQLLTESRAAGVAGGAVVYRFSLGQVWVAFAHRIGAVLVSLTLIVLVYKVLRLNRGRPSLIGLGLGLIGLLLVQVTLGALTVLLHKPADIASAHVACGALVLVTTFTLAARATRLYRARPAQTGVVPQRGFEVVRERGAAAREKGGSSRAAAQAIR